ncbi:MAG TPA: phage head closure protein [Atopostipes sp.]|nr:phage head closure protein [Atopostipes sp.]
MNAGEFNQRLIFMQPPKQDGAYPNPDAEPTVYTKAWGRLKTLKGSTRFIAAQSQMEHNRDFTIRYQKKLSDMERPKQLIAMWRDKEHEIESIEDVDGLKKEMLIVLKAVT